MWSYPMIIGYWASLINHCLPAGRGDSWAEIIPKEDWSKEQIKKTGNKRASQMGRKTHGEEI